MTKIVSLELNLRLYPIQQQEHTCLRFGMHLFFAMRQEHIWQQDLRLQDKTHAQGSNINVISGWTGWGGGGGLSTCFRVEGRVEGGPVEDRVDLVACGMAVVLEAPGLMVLVWWVGWLEMVRWGG